jgi:general secretion pathway protein G
MMKKRMKKGFTLIELLVVIAVIGILTALIVANFNAARGRARDAQRKSDLNQTKTALRMYYNDHNEYPNSLSDWGEEFSEDEMIYMKRLPVDPTPEVDYDYSQAGAGQDFCLWAILENSADGDIGSSQARCSDCDTPEGGYNYVVCAD